MHVVAEIGVNFDTRQMACEMIYSAAKIGCDYTKFQLFNRETIKESPLFKRLESLILNEDDIKTFKAQCERDKIGLILTPMYLEAVDVAAKYADLIKIRYKDRENQELIDKALATGKTLLISVPHRPIGALMYHPRIKWLYNIPKYPPEPEDFNLEIAASCDGISSHFPHTLFDLAYAINRIPEEAYIEKHVMMMWNWEPDIPRGNPIDKAVSISFEALKNFIGQLQLIERMKRIRL